MHHFVIRLPLIPGYLPKGLSLILKNFFTWKCCLHRSFCYGIYQQIKTFRFDSDDHLFRKRHFSEILTDYGLLIDYECWFPVTFSGVFIRSRSMFFFSYLLKTSKSQRVFHFSEIRKENFPELG